MLRSSTLVLALLGTAALAACSSGQPHGGGGPLPPGGPGGGPGLVGPVDVGPRPDFGQVTTQPVSPPPISGGTLIVSHQGDLAVAADPDRDQVYVVDLSTQSVTTVVLQPGDEPGRLIEDGDRRVHVAARRSGVVVTVDLATRKVVDRQSVCVAPRGVAYDPSSNDIYVVCATGELVTLGAAGGAPTRTVYVDRDLRDVIVPDGTAQTQAVGTALFVTRLKSAELLTLDSKGAILDRQSFAGAPAVETAWRTIPAPDGAVVMVHQLATDGVVSTQPGGYSGSGASCKTSIVSAGLSLFSGPTNQRTSGALAGIVLPVDVALAQDGSSVAVVSAGNGKTAGLAGLVVMPLQQALSTFCTSPFPSWSLGGQATAVAFDLSGNVLVQTREPASLYVIPNPLGASATDSPASPPAPITLSTVSREDTGHSIFHSNAGGFIACASCHPEGLEDGHVWTFDSTGARRTQSLRGTLDGTAPYHWDGDQKDIPTLAHEVFETRMSGAPLTDPQAAALQAWLFALSAPPAPPAKDAASVARGSLLFQSPSVGCAVCHAGPRFTNNATLNVHTAQPGDSVSAFQVPSLVGIGWRAPFLHSGCAATLEARFSPACTDGMSHGQTASLSQAQIADLIAYLGTL